MTDSIKGNEIEPSDDVANPVDVVVRLPLPEYDPNKRWHPQTLRITLMQWQYSKEFDVDVEVGGNCLGFNVFDCALDKLMEQLPICRLGGEDVAYVKLEDSECNTLQCEDEDQKLTDWLADMVVSIRIIAVAEKAERSI